MQKMLRKIDRNICIDHVEFHSFTNINIEENSVYLLSEWKTWE